MKRLKPHASLAIDDTALPKKGERSVGVAPQDATALGKNGNCRCGPCSRSPAVGSPFRSVCGSSCPGSRRAIPTGGGTSRRPGRSASPAHQGRDCPVRDRPGAAGDARFSAVCWPIPIPGAPLRFGRR
ncbi:transposase [Methylorubrum suomiense]|uniref:transposase n=1 Tax=Methylorubrum suomiense TaxID=144191 RepID=UPI0010FA334A